MAWFGQGKDTIEWEEFRDDVLFYKWPAKEIKRGSRLILRPGQKAIFYSDGIVGAVFEHQGNFDIYTDIVPFFSTLKGWMSLRGDSGLRAEVYFVNAKELTLPWGTRQRIMIPTPEVPSGIPVGCNGNLIIEFRDYQTFINQVAGVKATYSLEDVADRIMGELNPVVAEAILGGQQQMGLNALVGLQQNSRKLGKAIQAERELLSTLRDRADHIIDTSRLRPLELRQALEQALSQKDTGFALEIVSFGYKRGVPFEADVVLDMRFSPNPFYEPELRTLSGRDAAVQAFVLADENVTALLDQVEHTLERLIPRFIEQDKRRLMVAFGCTGGRHRSVCCAEALYHRMKDRYQVSLAHRDIATEAASIRERGE